MVKEGEEEAEWAKKNGKSAQRSRTRSGESIQSRRGVGFIDVEVRSDLKVAKRPERTETRRECGMD